MGKTENHLKEAVINAGKLMLVAARTAPKARGVDNLEMELLTGKDILTLADKTEEIGKRENVPSFVRDAENIRQAIAVIIIGTKIKTIGLKKCGMCGFESCAAKETNPDIPCVFNPGDLGIAVASAVSVAMDHRIDNRIMYTVGQAVLELKLLSDDIKIAFGIPLAAMAKNPFFDRK